MLVSDIIDDAKQILGKCDFDTILKRLTDAVVTLANKSNCDVLTGYVDICSTQNDSCSFGLPKDIDTPLAVNIGGYPRIFRNRWMEFHNNGMGSLAGSPWNWDDRGDFATVNNIITAGNLIAVADLKTDLSASLRVIGYDVNDKWIRTQDAEGIWHDGFLVPINLLKDFPSSIIVPDPNRTFIRNFTTSPIRAFMGTMPHDFMDGEPVVITTLVAPLPTPLVEGETYYVKVLDVDSVELYNSASNALTGTNPITITSAQSSSSIRMTDRSAISAKSLFESTVDHNIETGQAIQFTGSPLPVPLDASTTYYANVLSADTFTAHATQADAEAGVNFIDVSTPGTTVKVRALLPLMPVTYLSFSVAHNFVQGDAVMVANSGGELPSPLLAGVTYYVRYIDSTKITLHQSLADATSGDNAIILTSSGTGTSAVIKNIAASVSPGSTNNVTATSHNLTAGDLVAFSTTGTFPIPITQGTVYQASNPSSANTFTLANTSLSTKATASRARRGNVATIVTGTAHGFFTNDVIDVEGLGGTGYNATQVTITVQNSTTFTYANVGSDENTPVATANRARTANVATITTGSNHGYTTGDIVDVSGVGGTGYNAYSVTITVTGATTFTYANTGSNEGSTADTGGLVVKHVLDTGGSAVKGRINITSLGTGQLFLVISRSFTPGFFNTWQVDATNLPTGTGVVFDTDGAFPSTTPALDTSTTRYVRKISSNRIELFESSATASDSAVRTTTLRERTSNVAQLTFGVAHGFVAGDVVDISNMGDDTYNATRATILGAGLTATAFRYNNTGSDEGSTADTAGQVIFSNIKVNALGSGNTFLVLQRDISAEIRSSLLNISDAQRLKSGAKVTLETDGTLPSPLAISTQYLVIVQGDDVKFQTLAGVDITLTDIGTGNHELVLERDFTVEIPPEYLVADNEYTNGDAVLFQAGDSAPAGLIDQTTYYVRRISDDEIELYDTEAHAEDTTSTTGRIVATSTGEGVQKLVQTLPNFEVKKVERIVKSLTNGFIELYAWDTGRTDNLAFLGRFYPDELQPSYRRIKIPGRCPWIRIRYKRRLFELRSLEDFIPMSSRMALLMMLRANDLYRMNHFESGQAHEALADKFMMEEQKARSTPGGINLQFNEGVMTNPIDRIEDNFGCI